MSVDKRVSTTCQGQVLEFPLNIVEKLHQLGQLQLISNPLNLHATTVDTSKLEIYTWASIRQCTNVLTACIFQSEILIAIPPTTSVFGITMWLDRAVDLAAFGLKAMRWCNENAPTGTIQFQLRCEPQALKPHGVEFLKNPQGPETSSNNEIVVF